MMNVLGLHENAEADLYHLATALVHGIDYLLTWNCKHLANGRVRRRLERWSLQKGRFIPTVCTPEELMEEERVVP